MPNHYQWIVIFLGPRIQHTQIRDDRTVMYQKTLHYRGESIRFSFKRTVKSSKAVTNLFKMIQSTVIQRC